MVRVSLLWNFFEKIDKDFAKCKYCSKKIKLHQEVQNQ